MEFIGKGWLQIKMEWKKCKAKLRSKHYKQGCSKTVNSIQSHKYRHQPNNDRILTRDDDSIGHQFQTKTYLHYPFSDLFKQNHKQQDLNTKYSTFTHSLHTNHDSKLSKELNQIGRQFQHENDRIKILLKQIHKDSAHSKGKSSATMHVQKLSLSQKIKQQNVLLRTMCTLKPYR